MAWTSFTHLIVHTYHKYSIRDYSIGHSVQCTWHGHHSHTWLSTNIPYYPIGHSLHGRDIIHMPDFLRLPEIPDYPINHSLHGCSVTVSNWLTVVQNTWLFSNTNNARLLCWPLFTLQSTVWDVPDYQPTIVTILSVISFSFCLCLCLCLCLSV